MKTAKLFENGRSQAVRLPKEYRFDSDEILINKIGDTVMLIPKDTKWQSLISACGQMSDDFMAERNQPAAYDQRKSL